jgi:hypothetical protein
MRENKMGNRGSKSALYVVKEQRVDGSWHKAYHTSGNKVSAKAIYSIHLSKRLNTAPLALPLCLRCTLMGDESRYQIKIPSKQLNMSSFSTLNSVQISTGPASEESAGNIINP